MSGRKSGTSKQKKQRKSKLAITIEEYLSEIEKFRKNRYRELTQEQEEAIIMMRDRNVSFDLIKDFFARNFKVNRSKTFFRNYYLRYLKKK